MPPTSASPVSGQAGSQGGLDALADDSPVGASGPARRQINDGSENEVESSSSESEEGEEVKPPDDLLDGVDGANVSSFQFMVDYHDAVWKWHEGIIDGARTWDLSKVVFSDDAETLKHRSGHKTAVSIKVERVSLPLYKSQFDPKISFEVSTKMNSKCFCVVFDHYSGAMLASVTEILKPQRSSGIESWTKTVKFYRVYASWEAVKVVRNDKRQPSGIGKQDLEYLAKKTDKDAALTEFTYHRGNVEYAADVRDIIGVVRWLPVNYKTDPEKLPADFFKGYQHFDLIYVGDDINEMVSRATRK